MSARSRWAWKAPAGLLLLGLLPLLGGARRLTELLRGEITPENARFLTAPWPISLHIASCSIYLLLGAVQFIPEFRRGHVRLHRMFGRVLVASGLIAAGTGMWMAAFYPPLFGAGHALTLLRLVVGLAIGMFLCLGLAAALRRAIETHRTWMIRAYALSLGAGTQPLTLAIAYLATGRFDESTFTLAMAAAWFANAAIAEWLIRRRVPAPQRSMRYE